ncbi:MAG: SH3 domain-containing protein [Ardenticatenaceae bacterium]|nr:SH3 domain-containing protein [Ardenticatenaceae bacterium]
MEDKLQRGLRQLAEAGHDKDKLGMSLISLHGALEEYFRSQLAAEIIADENEQGRRRTDWQDLLNLWQRHRSLSYRDRELIFAKNGKRNAIAHGDSFEISRSEMEQYAQFVQDFMGIRATSRPAHKPPVQPVPRVKPSPPPPSQPRPIYQPISTQPRLSAKWSCRRRLAILSVIMLLLSCWPLISLYNIFEPVFQEVSTRTPGNVTRIISTVAAEEEKAVEVETAVTATPTFNTKTASGNTRIQTLGTSNVRSGPDMDSPVVGYTYHEEEYDVLETNSDETWYKIRLADGTEGWIGSSRVKVLPR